MGKSTKKKATSITGTIVKVVPIAFRLTGVAFESKVPGGGPTRIEEALNLTKNWPKVESIVLQLLKEQEALLLSNPAALGTSSGQRATDAVGRLGDAAAKTLKDDLEKTTEYRSLKSQLDLVKEKWDAAPTGWLVDTEKGLLILLGTVVVVGGTVAMFKWRGGDWAAPALEKVFKEALAQNARVTVGGVFEAGVSSVDLKPSKGTVTINAYAVVKYRALKSTTKVAVKHVLGKKSNATVGHETVIDLGTMSLVGKGNIRGKNDYDVGLHVRTKIEGIQLEIGVTGKFDPTKAQSAPEFFLGTALTLSF